MSEKPSQTRVQLVTDLASELWLPALDALWQGKEVPLPQLRAQANHQITAWMAAHAFEVHAILEGASFQPFEAPVRADKLQEYFLKLSIETAIAAHAQIKGEMPAALYEKFNAGLKKSNAEEQARAEEKSTTLLKIIAKPPGERGR